MHYSKDEQQAREDYKIRVDLWFLDEVCCSLIYLRIFLYNRGLVLAPSRP